MFPDAHKFVIEGGCFNEAQNQTVDMSTNFTLILVGSDQVDLGTLQNPETWKKLVSKAMDSTETDVSAAAGRLGNSQK